jgi:hypothetical protein
MATYISNQTGFWSASSTWLTAFSGVGPLSAAGRAPQSNGGDKIIIRNNHVVTYDVSGVFGDESAAPTLPNSSTLYNNNALLYSIVLSAGGTLKASRLSSTSLTARGTIYVGYSGKWDWGTFDDPIPENVNAHVYLNYATNPITNKYGFILYEFSSGPTYNFADAAFTAVGAYKERNTFITSNAVASTSTITVDAVSGWKIGDTICIESDTFDPSRDQITTITNISGNTITIQPVLSNARLSGTNLGNFSSNVTFAAWSSAYPSSMLFRLTPAGKYQFKNAAFIDVNCFTQISGTATSQHFGGFNIINSEYRKDLIIDSISTLSYTPSSSVSLFHVYGPATNTVTFNNCNARNNTIGVSVNQGLRSNIGVVSEINNCNFYRYYQHIFSGPASNITFNNCKMHATGQIFTGSTIEASFNNCTLKSNLNNSISTIGMFNTTTIGKINVNNCTISAASGFKVYYPANASSGELIVSDCTTTNNMSGNSDMIKVETTSKNAKCQTNDNKNLDYRLFNSYYYANNDFSERKNGITSLKIRPQLSLIDANLYFNIPATEGVSQRFKFNMKYDTAYFNGLSSGKLPTINFNGTGISTTLSASSSENTWTEFDYTINPNKTEDIKITITLNNPSTASYVWFDGFALNPFIKDIRHYGFVFDKNPYRTVNTLNVLTENEVSTLSSISNLDYLYDAATYWSVTNPSLTSYVDLVTVNGSSLDFGSKNIIINNIGMGFVYDSTTDTITLDAPILSTGTNFNSIKTTGIVTLSTGLIADINIDANIIQNTPTNLTGIRMLNPTNTLTYNTNNTIEVEYINCTMVGVKNDGTAIVTIKRTNSTVTESDAEIVTYAPTLIDLTLQNGYIALYDNNGTRRYYQNTDEIILLPANATGVWVYKIARYGYQFISNVFTINPSVGGIIDINPNYIPDTFIDVSNVSTVSAYTDLNTIGKIHDYLSYYLTTSEGIDYGILDDESFGVLNFYGNLIMSGSATNIVDYNLATNTLKLKSLSLNDDYTLVVLSAFTTDGGHVIGDALKIRASNLDSELYFSNFDSIVFYPTELDRDNNTNAGLSASGVIYRFKYGSTINSVTFSDYVYSRITIGNSTVLNKTAITSGSTSIDLGTVNNIQTILANQRIINSGVQKASKLIPHTINI